jgi:SanA protein
MKKKTLPFWKRAFRFLNGLALLLVLSIVLSDGVVEYRTQGKLYNDLQEVPYNKVGLLLGTSKYSSTGKNLFYVGRIKAAVDLFDAGKIDYILISGDNSTKYYNEPKQFREDLIKLGIPSSRIVMDFAGFRTLDSVVRAKEVFQEEKITVISQQFHAERAVFIADAKGIDAIGYCAADVEGKRGIMVKVRERLARVQMIWDLIIGTSPKFYGDPIPIG